MLWLFIRSPKTRILTAWISANSTFRWRGTLDFDNMLSKQNHSDKGLTNCGDNDRQITSLGDSTLAIVTMDYHFKYCPVILTARVNSTVLLFMVIKGNTFNQIIWLYFSRQINTFSYNMRQCWNDRKYLKMHTLTKNGKIWHGFIDE